MQYSDLGTIALYLAMLLVVYAGFAALAGEKWRKHELVASARRAIYLAAACTTIAVAILVAGFLTHDYSLQYVTEHSSNAMPWYYTISAFYGGQEGSLLYWCWTLSIFAALATFTFQPRIRDLQPYFMATLAALELFFLIILTFVASPFTQLSFFPSDGQGLNPLLQDPGMLIHPPMLLIGYMSFSIPFAFVVAAMLKGRLDNAWLYAIRRWMLTSWMIQSAGLMLGAWWAYHVLGWGGYWGWDPVENAALMPWLMATAFLHSTMVQERRGMLKVWNVTLVLAAFALSIFGTFEVRSGVIQSVHSFAVSSIGPFFFGFLIVILAVSLGLFFYRLPKLKPEQEFDSILSRESSFLVNNLLFVAIAFATFWGTTYPIISQLIRNQTITVGAPFYEQVNGPLFLVLIIVMGIGPMLAWKRTSPASAWKHLQWPAIAAVVATILLPLLGARGVWADLGFGACVFCAGTIFSEVYRGVAVRHAHGELWVRAFIHLVSRYRRRYGGYLVHIGLLLIAVGAIASHVYQQQQEFTLHKGQSADIGGYTLTYSNFSDTNQPGIEVIDATVNVSQNGNLLSVMHPIRQLYQNFTDQPTTRVALSTYNLQDLYLFLADWQGNGSTITLRAFINPLVDCVWSGGLILILGGIICWWPERKRLRGYPAASVVQRELEEVAVS